ncbi:MAG TPA: DUF2206 domain-containing protein [Candidatus Saccharimonadia bacterium]
MISTLQLPANWPGTIASLALLLLVPGFAILRLVLGDQLKLELSIRILYWLALSLLYLMVTGLISNQLWPLVGVTNPLATTPVVLAFGTTLALLVTASLAKHPLHLSQRRPRLTAGEVGVIIGSSLLPLLAAGGATALNNRGSNTLALTALIGAIGLGGLLIWPLRRLSRVHAYALYCIALSILLANSLRGWFITGHDVVQEYQVFQLTLSHSHWDMAYLRDAYNACLSITILPTILARFTTILADQYIYKLLFQMIFASLAPLVYLLVKRFDNRSTAILSALLFVSFPTFITDMTMLGRQEVAFLFFGLCVLTLCDTQLPRRSRSILVFLLIPGIILSHYSTSYVALGIIMIAKLYDTVFRLRLQRFRLGTRPSSGALSWAIALVMLLSVYFWNSQITATSQSIASTLGGVVTSLPKLLQRNTQTGVNQYSLVGAKLSEDELFRAYVASVPAGREFPANEYYPASITNKYPVVHIPGATDAPTNLGSWIQSHLHLNLYDAYDNIRSSYAKLVQVAIVFGLALLVIWKRRRDGISEQYILLGLAALTVIALQVLLPSSIINYGLLRLIQQSLILLAPAIVIAFEFGWGIVRSPKPWRPILTGAILTGFFAVNANVLPVLTGGYKPALSTSNRGFYYEAYVTHADEIAGFQWLANHAPKGAVVYADEFARRKMITYAGIYARANLAPAAISRDSYVFISDANDTFNRVPFYYDGTLLYQEPPTAFLKATKNLVYANDHVKIYK